MRSVPTLLRGVLAGFAVLAGLLAHAQPPCNANAMNNPPTQCPGSTFTLTGMANGGQAPYTYSWSPATGLSNPNAQNPVVTVQGVATTYTLTITDDNGCTDTDQVTVTPLPGPTATLSLQAPAVQSQFGGYTTYSLCDPALSWNFLIDDASSGVVMGSTLTVNWGDGSPVYSPGTSGWSTNHTYAQGLHVLTYTITNPNGCASTQQVQVFLGTNPGGGISTNPNTNICTGGSLPFFLNNVLTNTPGTTYLIDFGDGTDTLLQQPPPAVINHVYNVSSCPGGSFTVSFIAQNPCDQTNGQISPIRVSQTPVVDFSLSTDTVCVNGVVTATDASLGLQAPQCTQPKHLWSVSPAAGWVLSSGTLGNANGQPGNPGLWTGGSASLGVQFTAPGTYTITDVVGNVCGFDTLSRSICVEAPPVPAFTLNPNPICVGQQVTTDNTSTSANSCLTRYQWQVNQTTSYCNGGNSTAYVAGTTASSFEPVIQFNSAGVYTVVLQAINSCPVVQVTQPVTVVGLPQVSVFPVGPICAGQSIFPVATFLQCGGVLNTPQWTTTGGTPGTGTGTNPGGFSYPNAGNFSVNVSVGNQCGNAQASAPLVVNPVPPSASATANPTTLCAGATLQLQANTIPGATYSWTGPNGFSSTLEDPSIPNATVAMSGTYTVTATLGVCAGPPSSVTVTVNPAPILGITPSNPSICAGANVTLTANGGSGYTWTANGNPAGAGTSITVNPATTTTYTVNGAGLGCTGQASTVVTVNPLPVVNAGPDVNLCNQPIATQLTAVPAGGTWSGSPNVTAAGVFTPSGTGTFTLTYSYTNASNCTGTDQVDVTVAPVNNPANAGADQVLCVGAPPINLAGVPAGGSWSGSVNVTAGGVFTPNAAGIFNLTYTSGTGTCQTSDGAVVTVNALPVVDAGNAFSACLNAAPVALNGTPAGGTWSGAGVTGSSFNPATAGVGNFPLTYSYTNANNCTATDVVMATVNVLPTSNAGPDQNLCDQPIATLLNGVPAGGTWSGPNISAGGSFTPNGTGTFTVYYTVTNASNCSAVDSAVVTVSPVTNPANAGPDQGVCIGSAALNLVGAPAGGTWSGTGVTAGGVFTPNTAGAFLLTYAVGSGTCVTQDQVIITVNALPSVDAGSPQELCVDAGVLNLLGTPAGGTWSGTAISAGGAFNPATAGAGTWTETYTYTNGNGCTNSDITAVTVNPLPVVSAGNDQLYCDQPFPQQLLGTPPGGSWTGPNVSSSGLFTPNGTGVFNVTYTYTDLNFCSSTDQADITVIPVVNPANAGPDLYVCINSGAFQLNGLPAGGTWSGSAYVTAGGLFDPSVAGVYQLTYSEGSGTCITSDQVSVTVYALPVVNAGPDVSACHDAGVQTVTGAPAGGTWSGTGITDAVLGLFDPLVSGPGSFALTYTYTDPFTTCTNSDGLTLTVNPLPLAAFSNAPIACVNAPFPFTDLSAGASNWLWDFGDGAGLSIAQNPQHTYADTGVYVVTLIASTNLGCDDTTTTTLTVWEPPTVAFSLAPVNGCGPLPVSFTNTSTGTGVSYAWDFGNGLGSVLQNPPSISYVASAYADTVYTVVLSAANFCGVVQAQETVTVYPTPTAIFGPDLNTGCSPWTPTFSNVTIGQASSFVWDFGDGSTLVSMDSLVQHTYTTGVNDTTFTVTLVATNFCGSDTATYDVTVQPNTVTAFFNTDTLQGCAPLTVDFTQYSIGATNWGWDFGDGNVTTQQSPTHTYLSAGTFTVQLFVDNGCSYDTTTQVITVFPSPAVAFTWAPDSVCAGEPFQFTNMTPNTANIVWTFGDGTGSVLSDPAHTYAGTGTYNVTATVTSSINGCVAALTQPVTVKTTPVAAMAAAPSSGCAPLAVQFQNTSTDGDYYTWDLGDGNTSGLPAPAHTYPTPGTYVIQLVAQNLSGCTDTAYTQVVAFPVPTAAFDFTPDSSCVSPALVQFENQSQGAINFAWTFGNNQASALNEPSVSYAAPGTYTIQLIAQNAYGCTDSVSHDFTVYPTPEALFTVEPQPGCDGYPVTFLNQSVNATGQWWMLGDGTWSTMVEPLNVYPGPGLYDVMLVVSGAGGCLDTLVVDDAVLINPTPVAAFSFDTLSTLANALQFINGTSGASSYQWDFGDGEGSMAFAPLHLFPAGGGLHTICLIATNDLGCPDTVCTVIDVPADPQVFAPNAFTPDGDGLNDGFTAVLDGFGGWRYRLLIFDRWGEVIWESRTPGQPWDGSMNGQPCKTDVYVWKVILDRYGDERNFVGHVTLIRGDY